MIVVDAHAHLGYDEVFDHDFTAGELIAAQERHGIDVTLVQPGTVHDVESVRVYHDAIAELGNRYPHRFRGIANPNPHLPGDAYEREVHRCIDQLGFVGIKLHPMAHAVNPLGRHGKRVFTLAQDLCVPVMVHTGAEIPWSSPALIGPIAEEHPKVPIILAHAGANILSAEAGIVAERHANVHLECSWTAGFRVHDWVRRLGAERVMFGSDHAENAATELEKFHSADLSEAELTWVLGKSAARLFRVVK